MLVYQVLGKEITLTVAAAGPLQPKAYALLYALPRGQCDLIWLYHIGLLPCAYADAAPPDQDLDPRSCVWTTKRRRRCPAILDWKRLLSEEVLVQASCSD